MTKSIQQIKQELEHIESAVSDTAMEFQDKYRDYLDLLSQSVKKQLTLACYQICTQFYPESFLNLSLSNKQDLQQMLRQTGNDLRPKLLSIIEQQELEPEPNELNLMAKLLENLPKSKAEPEEKETGDREAETPAEEIDLELVKAELAKAEIANIEFIAIDTSDDGEDGEPESAIEEPEPANEPIELNNPEHLILWYKQIERKIKKNLDRASKEVNKSLQNSQIIPNRIPSKVIDVAIQTDGNKGGKNNRKLPKAPNIIHLSIETDKPSNMAALRHKKSQNSQNSTQISLLRLRLAEIEFSDPLLNAKRGQIRNSVSKISKLGSQYKNVKHQAAVAEAQAAWRSSWYEE